MDWVWNVENLWRKAFQIPSIFNAKQALTLNFTCFVFQNNYAIYLRCSKIFMRFTKTVTKISYCICSSILFHQESEWHGFYLFLVYSSVELCKTLPEIDGVMYILNDKFNHDFLEEHFGR